MGHQIIFSQIVLVVSAIWWRHTDIQSTDSIHTDTQYMSTYKQILFLGYLEIRRFLKKMQSQYTSDFHFIWCQCHHTYYYIYDLTCVFGFFTPNFYNRYSVELKYI